MGSDGGISSGPVARPLRALYRSSWALALSGAIAGVAVLLAVMVVPYLQESRRVATEVPQPAPLAFVALVELRGGEQACSDQIGLLPGRQVAEIHVGTFGKPAAPLRLTLVGPGYREAVPVPPSYVDNALVDVPFDGPSKVLEGSVCVANRGHRKIALYASEDRTRSRSTTTVAGRLWSSNFDLSFYAARPQSLLDRADAIIGRLRIFHAHVGIGFLWLLCVLFAIGVPLAAIAAVVLGWRQADSDAKL